MNTAPSASALGPQATLPIEKQLTIPTHPDAIYAVESIVDELRQTLEISEDVYANLMVAVTEAVNNAVYHGNKEDAKKTIHVAFLAKNAYRLVVRVRDEGIGFDPASLPDPTAPENIGKLSGRGVFLMQQLADEISFADSGRAVEMVFDI